MNRIEGVLRAATTDLAELRLRWALVGGLAVSARTEPRFTRDVDHVIAVRNDTDAEQAVHALQRRGYRILALVEQEAGIEAEVASMGHTIDILPGLRVPVATVGRLLALKLLSRDHRTRPQDQLDLVGLLRVAGPDDLEGAHQAVSLIHARGFQANRDLPRDLERLVAEGI